MYEAAGVLPQTTPAQSPSMPHSIPSNYTIRVILVGQPNLPTDSRKRICNGEADWSLSSYCPKLLPLIRSAPGTRLRLHASVVTTDAVNGSSLRYSGPTPRRSFQRGVLLAPTGPLAVLVAGGESWLTISSKGWCEGAYSKEKTLDRPVSSSPSSVVHARGLSLSDSVYTSTSAKKH